MIPIDNPTTNYHRNITAALKRLNSVYPAFGKIKSFERYVEIRIINNVLSKGLMYKIDDDLPDEVKNSIMQTILEQADKLKMEVITQ